jgi:hypothetical protein
MSNHQENLKSMSTKELYHLWKETRDEKYLYAFIDLKENDPENIKTTKEIFEQRKDN